MPASAKTTRATRDYPVQRAIFPGAPGRRADCAGRRAGLVELMKATSTVTNRSGPGGGFPQSLMD